MNNAEWMRQYREKQRGKHTKYKTDRKIQLLIDQGKCPNCELFLNSRFHDCGFIPNPSPTNPLQ